MAKPRGRDLGLRFPGQPGPLNAITDVPGVLVGQTTLDGSMPGAAAPTVRTGVTAILPRGHSVDPVPVLAGTFALNGNGEMTGCHWIRDAGSFLGPVCITNTHSVGIAHHAAVRWMIRHHAATFGPDHIWAMPVIAETYDGVLNDINGQHLTEAHVLAALQSAQGGPVAEGNTGGGTGMICYEFKGGTGTASRRIPVEGRDFHVGVLVQANHGLRDWLTVLGEPVGQAMQHDRMMQREAGSIIVVIATDLPLRPDQLERVARRASIGIGRSGTPGGNSSGDIFLAFSTAAPAAQGAFQTLTCLADAHLDPVYLATVEATDEAIINAMLAACDMPTLKPAGRICRAIDGQALAGMLRGAGKCG
ncbi:P1 family peptidase [Paracoccaceae bacterium Fryx2]|nr:P1 family peptidase [Paracoccaceae bacterium Fryx2]